MQILKHLNTEDIDINFNTNSKFFLSIPSIANNSYFSDRAGNEHYRLLSFVSNLFDNISIFDVGTHCGWSSFALASNQKNRIVSYDVDNSMLKKEIFSHIKNIEFKLGLAHLDSRLLLSDIILLDVAHDGVYEKIFLDFLIQNNYKGVLLVDDIYLNNEMLEFWASIKFNKTDISKFGHISGTGFVDFSNE
jgi:predicted O-methyltransferase YrrM